MAAPEAGEWDHAAVRIWRMAAQAAAKGKLLAPAEAEARIGHDDVDALDRACAAMQAWCWVRGMPPLDRVIAHPRVQGAVREVADYDVFFEALGRDVQGEAFVLAYPWTRVREPLETELAWARALMAAHGPLLRKWRFLDLEMELLERDGARGRRRPEPVGHASWSTVMTEHRALSEELMAKGMQIADLRPPGKAPYPPPPPRDKSGIR